MPGDTAPHAIELQAVSCKRGTARLDGVDLAVPAQRLVAIRGDDCGGKELLLKLAGLLEAPDAGRVFANGVCASELDENARAELRRSHFAYLFAAPFLLPGFTVIENVVMPMFKVLDSGPAEARCRAEELLHFVGAGAFEESRAGDLSPLDQRCVALARALAIGPAVLLAEEPAEDLPPDQHRHYVGILRAACRQWDVTALIAVPAGWHATGGDIVFDLVDGKVVPAAQELPRG